MSHIVGCVGGVCQSCIYSVILLFRRRTRGLRETWFMRILVCFKITRDLDAFTADEWSRMNEHRHDLSLAPRILGLYDEGALEHARRWKESLLAAGEPVTLEGLTVGAGHYDTICSNLFAIGYDRLYCLDTKEESLRRPVRHLFSHRSSDHRNPMI